MSGFLSVMRHTLSEALHRKLIVTAFIVIVLELLLTAALVGSASGMITIAGALLPRLPEGREALRMIFGALATS